MKRILVTGVSRGLGFGISKLLLEKGYIVFGISRRKTDELKFLLSNYSDTFFLLNYDLEDIRNIKRKIFSNDFIGLKLPLDGFVNNAAYAYDDIVTNYNIDELVKMFNINVFSAFILTKYVIRNMLYHRIQGSIVHISSISVHTGYKGLSAYASTKGAMEAFSKNVAREWGERGIRSNCVVAGFMETDMSSSLSSEQKKRIYRRTALKKATEIKSVANTVEFLLSDFSSSVTGQNIFVDSGTI